MKIITWNCNGAFRNKFESLKDFSADLFVIQECENPELSKNKKYKDWAINFLWTGENKHKGLGIFANDKIKLSKLNWNTDGLKYFLPCRIDDKFNMIGTWCHGDAITFKYIGQFWKYLQLHKLKLDNCIIAGDFNSNVIWDKLDRLWNHSEVVRELKELEIESLYHLHFKEAQGKELKPTLYLQRNSKKPYHIDYIFGSKVFQTQLKTMSIGEPNKWLNISDHMPVICEL